MEIQYLKQHEINRDKKQGIFIGTGWNIIKEAGEQFQAKG